MYRTVKADKAQEATWFKQMLSLKTQLHPI
jgi:hypothetical protein